MDLGARFRINNIKSYKIQGILESYDRLRHEGARHIEKEDVYFPLCRSIRRGRYFSTRAWSLLSINTMQVRLIVEERVSKDTSIVLCVVANVSLILYKDKPFYLPNLR